MPIGGKNVIGDAAPSPAAVRAGIALALAAVAALGGCATTTQEWRNVHASCLGLWYERISPETRKVLVQRHQLETVPGGDITCNTVETGSLYGRVGSPSRFGTTVTGSYSGLATTTCTQGTALIAIPYASLETVDDNAPRRDVHVDACTANECLLRYGNTACDPAGGGPSPRTGADDRAIEDFEEVMRAAPSPAAAFVRRGAAYHGRGEFGRAIEDFTRAIRLRPELAAAFTGRARAYAARGEAERAIADFDEAIRLEPGNAAAGAEGGSR